MQIKNLRAHAYRSWYMTRTALIISLALIASSPSLAHDVPEVTAPLTQPLLLQVFGWDMDNARVTSQPVGDRLHVLFGIGGNIAVSIGEDGVLLVDDQFPAMLPRLQAAIKQLGGGAVDFVINTHWHFDHAEGNLVLGKAGTWIISQENSRDMMQQDHLINLVVASYKQAAYPAAAWPDITYTDAMKLHLNGETIELLHFGPAHTTGDTAIFFKTTNAVHLGDVFNNAGYPFIDAGNGGTLNGVIHFCKQVLKIINHETVVIPGHGPIADYATLAQYTRMLGRIRDRMMAMIQAGKSLDEIQAANITAAWDQQYGDPGMFINRAYMSLSHRVVDR